MENDDSISNRAVTQFHLRLAAVMLGVCRQHPRTVVFFWRKKYVAIVVGWNQASTSHSTLVDDRFLLRCKVRLSIVRHGVILCSLCAIDDAETRRKRSLVGFAAIYWIRFLGSAMDASRVKYEPCGSGTLNKRFPRIELISRVLSPGGQSRVQSLRAPVDVGSGRAVLGAEFVYSHPPEYPCSFGQKMRPICGWCCARTVVSPQNFPLGMAVGGKLCTSVFLMKCGVVFPARGII